MMGICGDHGANFAGVREGLATGRPRGSLRATGRVAVTADLTARVVVAQSKVIVARIVVIFDNKFTQVGSLALLTPAPTDE